MMKTIHKNLTVNRNVFKPTGTSQLLVNSAKKIIKAKKILDLNWLWNGIIGINLLML